MQPGELLRSLMLSCFVNIDQHTMILCHLPHFSKVLCQLDDDPLFIKCSDGASVAAKNLDKIDRPALVIIGERDKQFARASDMMVAKLPQATKVLVKDSGHMANEKQPVRFNDEVRKFIQSLAPTET